MACRSGGPIGDSESWELMAFERSIARRGGLMGGVQGRFPLQRNGGMGCHRRAVVT